MEMLGLIIALSAVIWYVIDRAKTLYTDLTWGKWITIGLAALGSAFVVFSFGLDLIFAVGLVAAPSVAGQILTALVMMSGSSAIAEIIGSIKG